jgi:hypothetical protein
LREDLQSLAQDGAFTAIWSPWIIAELYRTLTWRWLAQHAVLVATAAGTTVTSCDLSNANWVRCGQMANRMMELLLATPNWEIVDPRPPYPLAWESLADIWDYPIWAAAVAGAAQYVVSDNKRDYPPASGGNKHVYGGVEYMSGADFVALLSD